MLSALSVEQRHAIMEVLVAVAAADGEVVAEEAACLEALMGAAMIHPEARAVLRSQLAEPPLWSASLAQVGVEHGRLLLYLSAYVAAVDGAYDEEEVSLLREICNAMEADLAVLESAFEWVEQGLEWAAAIDGEAE